MSIPPNVNVFQELSKIYFQNPALILAILVLFPSDSNILFSRSLPISFQEYMGMKINPIFFECVLI